MTECDFQGSVTKDILPSWVTHSGEASCPVVRRHEQFYGEAHMVRNWHLLPIATRGRDLGSGFFSLFKPSDDCSTVDILIANSLKIPTKNYPAKLLVNSWLTKIVKQLCKAAFFCTPSDDDISFWPGIISRSPQNCNLKSPRRVNVLPRGLSQMGLQIAVNKGLPSAA